MTRSKSHLTRRELMKRGMQASMVMLGSRRAAVWARQRSWKLSQALPDTRGKGLGVWDVSAYDYLAEEFLLTGTATVYEPVCMADTWTIESRDMTADFAVRDFRRKVLRTEVPYTTRLIVYKPRDAARFTGNAIVETLHPNKGGTGLVWDAIHRYFLSRGDAYVCVQHPVTIAGLRAADLQRYGNLEVVDPTQLWGMLQDTGSVLKEAGSDSPLHGYALRHLLMTGYSYTGVATASFANYHHAQTLLADGRPVYDAYVPMADSQYVRPLNVPVIRLNTQSDFDSYGGLHNRRPDDALYRHYEVAGAAHAAIPPPADAATLSPAHELATPKGQPSTSPQQCLADFPAGSHLNDFPLYLVQEAVFERMLDWVQSGRTPPPSLLIETGAAGKLGTDRWGNALGGVRYPQISVPVARYGVGSKGICLLYGYTSPFAAATCRSLYGRFEDYLRSAGSAAQRLVESQLLRASSERELAGLARANRALWQS
jgi:hypothetical protein